MTADPQSPWSGPWADDARRIYAILQGHEGHHPGTDGEPADGEVPSSPECAYCPLCQGMAVVRRSGPEVLDRVAELAAGLAATLRAVDPEPDDGDRGAGPPAAGPAPRPPVTVPIDVSD